MTISTSKSPKRIVRRPAPIANGWYITVAAAR